MYESKECSILIVDDNPKNLQVLGSALKDAGYKIEAAIDGKEALEWLKEKTFDLVLLDVMMPGMDGFEVCKIIRKNKKLDNLPVLFLTAKVDRESIIAGFKMGAQDYITKPFDSGELLARVKTHIDLKRSKEVLQETNKWLETKVAERTKELADANAELMGLDNAKTDFLNIISHEIRTPLNGILGFLGILKDRIDSDELKTFFDLLDLSATRLEKFATTALHITNLQVKKTQINLENLSINQVVNDSIQKINDQLSKKDIDISYKASGSELILGDYELLVLSFMNILENAIKYSGKGGRIRIKTESNNNNVFCEVSDEGTGFSSEALNSLFKLFTPGEAHIDSNKGLSLCLVKLIIEAHGGKIEARNNKTKGATVFLTFRKVQSN